MISIVIYIFLAYSIYKILRRKLCKPDFSNKIIWITGASSGIGQYLSYELNEKGAQIIISARNVKQLQRVKNACHDPSKVTIVKLDMTNFNEIQKVTKQVIDKLQKQNKKLYMIIQNAGVSMRCQFKDYPFENHLSMFNVNVNGPFKHLQCILPHMLKNKQGHIVGVSSVAGKIAPAYRSSYSGSKSALIGILDSLRTQLYQDNIKVSSIIPGYIKTNISINALSTQAGKTFGKTDKNIEKGMDVKKFSIQAVKAIYRQQNQVQISQSLLLPFGIQLRNLCPDLLFLGTVFNSKNQSRAIKQAKSQ